MFQPLLLSLALLSSTSATLARPSADEDFEQRLAEVVERMETERVALHIPGFALAIVKDDEVVLARGFGLADVEKERPVEADTIFAIGSSTKAFTAMALGMLEDEGKLDFDDPVTKYLPYFELAIDAPEGSTVTLRDLLCHRTGFTRMTALWGPGTASRDLILHTAVKAEPWARFREKFLYNNVMFLAAGEAGAAAAGQTWEQLIETKLFEPLGMSSSNLSTLDAQKDERLALGYTWNTDTESFDHKRMVELTGIAPAGSINSNVLDMAQWLRFQLGNGEFEGRRLVSEAVIHDTWTPNITIAGDSSYGLGWMLHESRNGRVIEHGGNIDGFGAEVAFMPEAGIGFVLLTNVSVTPLQSTSRSIVFDTLLDEAKAEDAVESEQDFDRFVGDYVANFGPFDDTQFEVLVQNENLAVDIPGQTIYELHLPDAEGKRTFRLTDTVAVSFDIDEDGNTVGMKLYQSGLTFELPRKGVQIEAEVPIEQFDRFLGSYRDEAGKMTVEVKVANNRLAVDIPGQMVFELRLPDEDGRRRFRVTDNLAVRFNEDETGVVGDLTFFEKDQVKELVRVLDDADRAALALPTLEEFFAMHGASDRALLLLEHGTYRSKGTIRLAQSGIEGEYVFEVRQSPPASYLKVDLGPFGSNEFGSDGKIVWSANSVRGYQESSGDELKQRLRDHPSILYGDWKTGFDEVKLEGKQSDGDRQLLVVETSWGELPPRKFYLDADSGQRVRSEQIYLEGPVRVELSTKFEDYSEVSGVPIWHVMTEENVHSGRTIQTLTSIELGVELADGFHAYKGSKD